MLCPYCGEIISETTIVCPYCGLGLKEGVIVNKPIDMIKKEMDEEAAKGIDDSDSIEPIFHTYNDRKSKKINIVNNIKKNTAGSGISSMLSKSQKLAENAKKSVTAKFDSNVGQKEAISVEETSTENLKNENIKENVVESSQASATPQLEGKSDSSTELNEQQHVSPLNDSDHNIISEVPEENLTKKNLIGSLFQNKILIGVLAGGIFIAGGIMFLRFNNSPDKQVENYLISIRDNKYTVAQEQLQPGSLGTDKTFEKFINQQIKEIQDVPYYGLTYDKNNAKIIINDTDLGKKIVVSIGNKNLYYEAKPEQGIWNSITDKHLLKDLNIGRSVVLEANNGTKVTIDGKMIGEAPVTVQLLYGKHECTFENVVMESKSSVYNVLPSTESIKTTMTIDISEKGELYKSSLEFVNVLLNAICNETPNEAESKTFVKDETIQRMYDKLLKYVKAKPGNAISKIAINSGRLLNVYMDGESIKGQFVFEGLYQRLQNPEDKVVSGTIQAEYIIKNNDIKIVKINSFNMHFKK